MYTYLYVKLSLNIIQRERVWPQWKTVFVSYYVTEWYYYLCFISLNVFINLHDCFKIKGSQMPNLPTFDNNLWKLAMCMAVAFIQMLGKANLIIQLELAEIHYCCHDTNDCVTKRMEVIWNETCTTLAQCLDGSYSAG